MAQLETPVCTTKNRQVSPQQLLSGTALDDNVGLMVHAEVTASILQPDPCRTSASHSFFQSTHQLGDGR